MASDHTDPSKLLSSDEIMECELERYPVERIDEVPESYLETIENYAREKEENTEDNEARREFIETANSASRELERRERISYRLPDVPSSEDLHRIKQEANKKSLYERKARRREELETPIYETEAVLLNGYAGDEIRISRNHRFKDLLETEFDRDRIILTAPSQIKENDGEALYLWIEETEVKGIKYSTEGEASIEEADILYDLTHKISDIIEMAENEPERLGGFGDTSFLDTTKLYKEFLEARGDELDEDRFMGYNLESMDEKFDNYMTKSREAIEELNNIGVTYFEIEGFNVPEIASLINHLKARDRFDREILKSHEDTDLNEEDWDAFHEKIIREDTAENNALRLLLDDEDE